MYRIAVCEDEYFLRADLQSRILAYFKAEKRPVKVDCFSSCPALLEAAEKVRYDFCLLDIALGANLDGFDAARLLRKYYPEINIVFVTGFEEHRAAAFEVHAYHYLVKPLKEDDIPKLFDDYFAAQARNERERVIEITHHYQKVFLRVEDIIYIRKNSNSVQIFTDGETYTVYNTLQQILHKLGDKRFVQCGRGEILNMDKVTSIKGNNVFFYNGDKLSIGRTFRKPFLATYYQYKREQ